MKVFKTMARVKGTNERVVIESEYPTKKNFIDDLRANGYTVNEKRVAEKEKYDYIMDHTNATDEDFKLYR